MNAEDFRAGEWYWLRQESGSLAPFRLHQTKLVNGKLVGEFYVGSMLTTWSLGRVEGRAESPVRSRKPKT